MQNLKGGKIFSFPTLLDSYKELLFNAKIDLKKGPENEDWVNLTKKSYMDGRQQAFWGVVFSGQFALDFYKT